MRPRAQPPSERSSRLDSRSGETSTRRIVLAVALALFGFESCATTATQIDYWHREPRGQLGGKPIYVFGGTVIDSVAVFGSVTGSADPVGVVLIVDLPLSLAADVILLPLCVYEQFERSTWKESEFIARLEDRDARVRRKAAGALGGLNGTTHATVEALTKAVDDSDILVQSSAMESLAEIGARSASAAPAIAGKLADPLPATRSRAARTLSKIHPDPSVAVPALIAALRDPDPSVRVDAVAALAKVGGRAPEVIDALNTALQDPSLSVRNVAEGVLREMH